MNSENEKKIRSTLTHSTSSSSSRCQKEERRDSLRFLFDQSTLSFQSTENQDQSQGEERSTPEGFEIGPMKKAASMAHFDTSPRGKTR